MKVIKKVKYLGKTTKINESPDNFKLVSPEFTSICPITSQPDFAKIIIDYVPNKLIMESKSFKLFLVTFRNYGAFHEDCTIKIAKKIEKSIKPKWIRVCSFWNPRGGIPIDVFYQSGKKPKEIFIEELKIETYSSR